MDAPTRSPRPSPGQRALAEALARGQAAMGTAVQAVPASVDVDAYRYGAEQRAMFHKLPLLVAPSVLVPSPDLAVAHDGYSKPLLLTRDGQNDAHVLANVCRHRGTPLMEAREE